METEYLIIAQVLVKVKAADRNAALETVKDLVNGIDEVQDILQISVM